MSEERSSDEEYLCVFCEAELPRKDRKGGAREEHHFPVPERLGGEATVPCCRPCHDRADRMSLRSWSPNLSFGAMAGLWTKATVDQRILLWKMHVALLESMAKAEATSKKRKTVAAVRLGLEVSDESEAAS